MRYSKKQVLNTQPVLVAIEMMSKRQVLQDRLSDLNCCTICYLPHLLEVHALVDYRSSWSVEVEVQTWFLAGTKNHAQHEPLKTQTSKSEDQFLAASSLISHLIEFGAPHLIAHCRFIHPHWTLYLTTSLSAPSHPIDQSRLPPDHLLSLVVPPPRLSSHTPPTVVKDGMNKISQFR
jgi:hypothetical protein